MCTVVVLSVKRRKHLSNFISTLVSNVLEILFVLHVDTLSYIPKVFFTGFYIWTNLKINPG